MNSSIQPRWSRTRLLLGIVFLFPAICLFWQYARPWFHRLDLTERWYSAECSGQWGLIDKYGFEAIPFEWEYAESRADTDRYSRPRAKEVRLSRPSGQDHDSMPMGICCSFCLGSRTGAKDGQMGLYQARWY